MQVPLLALLRPEGKIPASAFVGAGKSIPDTSEVQKQLPVNISNADVAKGKLEAANIFVMAHKQVVEICSAACMTGLAAVPAPV